jgi:hypothetical protein
VQVITGLLRDFIVAVVGVMILVGVNISDSLLAGLLVVLSTGVALGTYIYNEYKASNP